MTHTKEYWMKAVAAGKTELSLAEWERQQVKHTPGPWREERERSDPRYGNVVGGGWTSVAKVVVATEDVYASCGWIPAPVGEANLRLILKAPEMLAKLKEVHARFIGHAEAVPLTDFIREIDPTY